MAREIVSLAAVREKAGCPEDHQLTMDRGEGHVYWYHWQIVDGGLVTGTCLVSKKFLKQIEPEALLQQCVDFVKELHDEALLPQAPNYPLPSDP